MSVSPALEPNPGASLREPLAATPSPAPRFDPRDVDWKAVFAHPLTIPGLLVLAGLVLAFLPMIVALPQRWTEDEYYSHGWLVPLLAGFITFRRWPRIAAFAARPSVVSAAPVALRVPLALAAGAATWAALYIGYRASSAVLAAVGYRLDGAAALGAGALALLAVVGAVAGLYAAAISLLNRGLGPVWCAGAILVSLLPLVYVSYVGNIVVLQSVLFVMAATLAVVMVAGWRWGFALFPAIGFLLFALPVWNSFIDGYTNPLQLASTKVAFQLLKATGFSPLQTDPTTIYLNNFQLNVAVPCSGMKLMLAVSAFTTLFILIANLRAWSNVFMAALVVPLCLFVNGLRIALIGMVGNQYGQEAGMKFHDYSGYITLVVCFFLLFKFARLLGWKD